MKNILTIREKEVFTLLIQNKTTKEIAKILNILAIFLYNININIKDLIIWREIIIYQLILI